MRVKISEIVIPDERARSMWSQEQKDLLAGAISEYGQLSDPLVRKLPDGTLELVDGESRLREFIGAGIEEIEVKIVELNDKDAALVNVLMNIARGEQDPVGIALAFKKAIDQGLSIEKIAAATKHTREWVQFHLMLNELPAVYKEALEEGVLRVGHIREAWRLSTPAEIDTALSMTIQQQFPVNILSNYVDNRLAEIRASEILSDMLSIEAPPPKIDPQRLAHTTQCLAHGGMIERDKITHPPICEDCYTLLKYIVSQIGTGSEAMQRIYDSLTLYNQYKQQQRNLFARRTVETMPPPTPTPQPTQSQPVSQSTTTLVKPEGMPDAEWEQLLLALRTKYHT